MNVVWWYTLDTGEHIRHTISSHALENSVFADTFPLQQIPMACWPFHQSLSGEKRILVQVLNTVEFRRRHRWHGFHKQMPSRRDHQDNLTLNPCSERLETICMETCINNTKKTSQLQENLRNSKNDGSNDTVPHGGLGKEYPHSEPQMARRHGLGRQHGMKSHTWSGIHVHWAYQEPAKTGEGNGCKQEREQVYKCICWSRLDDTTFLKAGKMSHLQDQATRGPDAHQFSRRLNEEQLTHSLRDSWCERQCRAIGTQQMIMRVGFVQVGTNGCIEPWTQCLCLLAASNPTTAHLWWKWSLSGQVTSLKTKVLSTSQCVAWCLWTTVAEEETMNCK